MKEKYIETIHTHKKKKPKAIRTNIMFLWKKKNKMKNGMIFKILSALDIGAHKHKNSN